MQLSLVPHPDTPPRSVTQITATVDRRRDGLNVFYVVACRTTRDLVLPAPAKPYRTDGLWQTTCLELFLQESPPGYWEFNFAPSSQWAAYSLASYREGMKPLLMDELPTTSWTDEGNALMMSAFVFVPGSFAASASISAVIEERDGTKSYWALAHPPGDPDFHHPDCFVLDLPPVT